MEKSHALLVGGIVILIVIAVVAYLYYSSQKKPAPPSPPSPSPKPSPKPPAPKPGPSGWEIFEQTYPYITDPQKQRIFAKNPDEAHASSISECQSRCEKNPECDSFTYFNEGVQNCQLFKFKEKPRLDYNAEATTYLSTKLLK